MAAGDTTARSSLSAKQRAAHEVIAAPPSDNLIAAKAAATLCALCGLAEGNAPLPDVQALLVRAAYPPPPPSGHFDWNDIHSCFSGSPSDVRFSRSEKGKETASTEESVFPN